MKRIMAAVALVCAAALGTPIAASAAPKPAVLATALPAGTVSITGITTLGRTWTATPKSWPSGTRFTYAWYDGTTRIGTARTYSPTSSRLGHSIKVTVHGSGSGVYTGSVSVRSAIVRVQSASPLYGVPWPWAADDGTNWDAGLTAAYRSSSRADKTQLAKILTQPRVVWFTSAQSPAWTAAALQHYIAATQKGDKRALVQFAVFGEFPDSAGGEAGRNTPLTSRQKTAYRTWIDAIARALGQTKAAIILEPDLALYAPPNNAGDERVADPAAREALVRYAAQKLAGDKNAAIYLDAGDSDWLAVSKEVPVLKAAGIQYVRGFALGATHYASIADAVSYGTALAGALKKAGFPSKHFVVDTADNGKAFTWLRYNAKYGAASFDNAKACASKTSPPPCVTLGAKPTYRVADYAAAHLTAAQKTKAATYVDGFLWFGRPWLDYQAWPFDKARAVKVATTTPFQ